MHFKSHRVGVGQNQPEAGIMDPSGKRASLHGGGHIGGHSSHIRAGHIKCKISLNSGETGDAKFDIAAREASGIRLNINCHRLPVDT